MELTRVARLFLISVPLVILSGCDGGPPSKGQPSQVQDNQQVSQAEQKSLNPLPKLSVSLQAGMEYEWYDDSSCTERNDETCVSREDYKELCLLASGATKLGSRTLAILNGRATYLLENGDVDHIDVRWEDGYKYGCRLLIEVSGIFQGSSTRETLEGGVTTFIVNQQGEVLAHSASEFN